MTTEAPASTSAARGGREATWLMIISTALIGASNYGYSLVLVWVLPAVAFSQFSSFSALLIVLETCAGAAVPWVLAREIARSAPGSERRRRAVAFSFAVSTTASLVAGLLVAALVSRYAGTAVAVAAVAATLLVFSASVAGGYIQGEERFRLLAFLRLAEMSTKIALGVASTTLGLGAAGPTGAVAFGAGIATVVGVIVMRKDLGDRPSLTGSPELWRQAGGIGGIQTAVAVLTMLDVLVAPALHGSSRALAGYQAMLVFARIPLFISSALAAMIYPRLAGGRLSGPRRDTTIRENLRLYLFLGAAIVGVVATIPRAVLTLFLPHAYVSAGHLLLPLAVAGLAAGMVNLTTTIFQAEGDFAPALRVLGICLVTSLVAIVPASYHLTALAWTSATATSVTATLLLAAARRRHPGIGRTGGTVGPLVWTAGATAALTALHDRPVPWVLAAAANGAAVLVVARPRPRHDGPLRVLHLGFEDPHRPGAGGGSVRTHEVNKRLAARGVEVTVVCSRHPGFTRRVTDGVTYVPAGWSLGPLTAGRDTSRLTYFAAVVLGLRWMVRRHDPDLVVEDFAAPFSTVGVPLLTGRPVVGVVQWFFARDKARQYKLPFGLVERVGTRSHRTLVAMSDDLAANLRERSPAAEITVIPNGLAPAEWRGAVEAAAPAETDTSPAWPRHGRRDLVYLGRLETAQKGLDQLLAAYALIAPVVDADLYVCGDGPDEDALRTLADAAGLAGRVHWLGRVRAGDRFRLLAAARLVCMPSRYESFGMVAAEALAVGTPVLSFDIPCLRALVTDRVGMRVPIGDIDGYAAAMARLVADPERCAELGAAGPAAVRHLDWDKVAARQLQVYERAAGRCAAGREATDPVPAQAGGPTSEPLPTSDLVTISHHSRE
jgi:glycosyltransferase involved in cell wall biosynthesis/O-antigen/teichoic acid export membrane protein